jgi:hypothetical protein
MKKIFLTSTLFFLFFRTITFAQYTVYYCDGCVKNGLCPVSQTFATYDEAKRSGDMACPGGGSRVVPGNNPHSERVGFTSSPIANGFALGLLGVLGGSLVKNASGENQWATGGAGGFFLASSITILTTRKKRSVPANIFIGATTFAAGAYSLKGISEANQPVSTEPKKDNTLLIVGGSAVAGAVIGGLMPNGGKNKSHKSSYLHNQGKSNFLSKLSVRMYGNRIGLVMSL